MFIHGMLGIKTTYSFPGFWAIVPVMATLLLIMAGPEVWFNRVVLSSRVMVGVGLISYPLYLWHWPLLTFARLIKNETPGVGVRAGLLIASLVLSWLTYQFVEKPFRFGRSAMLMVAALAVLMTTVGCLGYGVYAKNGLGDRFPPQIRNVTQHAIFRWVGYVRLDTCYLLQSDLVEHAPECIDSKRPLVALWGDSHAAALYPGLKKLQEKRGFGIAQLTQAGCEPIFGIGKQKERPNCEAVNQKVFEDLLSVKPDVIILHGAWRLPRFPITNKELSRKFAETLGRIKKAFVNTRIVVIGPVPRWSGGPQKVSFEYWKNALDKTKSVPVYLQADVLNDVDNILSKVALENGVTYISAIAELCKGLKCISRVGDRPEDFITVDYGHLSKAGSEYFVQKLEPWLFGQ